MRYVVATIKYRDDTKETVECADNPYFANGFLVIVPKNRPMDRRYVAQETVVEMSFRVK